MRENVIGRANVEDTPELKAYYKDLEKYEAGALWTVANKIEPWAPQSASVPVLWRYKDLREHVLRSVELGSAITAPASTRLCTASPSYATAPVASWGSPRAWAGP